MLLLVSGASKTVQKYAHSPHMGILHTPFTGNKIGKLSLPFVADNGAFAGFDEQKFIRMLNRMRDTDPLWVVATAVPFDAKGTTR